MVLFLGLSLFQTADGEEQLPDISKMTAEQVEALPQETLKQLPFRELMRMATGKEMPDEMLDLMLLLQLSKLLYFADFSDIEISDEIKKFQRDLGNPQTGYLTFGQFNELNRRYNRVGEMQILVPGFGDLYIGKYPGYVSAEGSWILDGEEIAFPINLSKVICKQETKTCLVISADVWTPPFDEGDDASQLSLDEEYYEIISWGKTEVVSQNEGRCRKTIMTINTNSKEVIQVTHNNETEMCDMGTADLFKVPKLKKPRIARLVPGFKVSYAYWKERKKKASEFFNSDVREMVKKMEESFK